ncbi:MAG: alpha-galactosidase [Bacteroidota bacterium]
MKKYCILPACFLFSIILCAQTKKTILVETKNSSLVFTIGANQRLSQQYFGKRLTNVADYDLIKISHDAYPTAGMDNQFEPAIRIVHADGNPSLDLVYVKEEQLHTDANTTITNITLKDPVYPVEVVLHFTAYANEDIIKSSMDITHKENNPVVLTNYASACLQFDADKYWLTQFHGDWAHEMQMQEMELTSGIKIIDSKLGSRANFYQSPMFFLSLNDRSTETHGDLVAGTLAWTGNFQFLFEIDPRNSLRILPGMNPYASDYRLEPNKKFSTPDFIFTFSSEGKGLASRNIHRWARNYAVLDGNKPRLTLLNNWEATHTTFNEEKLVELFDGAKNLGVDLFLLDDGWFGNKYPRDNDKAGLGDWQEDKRKLPNGLGYLVKEADKKGIKFGIWLEPEMVNPKSELYEKHPDWILKLPNRAENYGRNQLVLDLVNPQVQDFIYKLVDDMLTKDPGLAYIKWDCNRAMSNTYSPYLKENQSALFIEYTRSFYKILDRLRARYPHLPIMLCSGGGGRTDYGAMKYFTEFWPSDNTDGFERVYIQWGYSYFFPSNTISAHVTSWGKQSLKFRTDVAMMDKMGYDIKVTNLTPQELQFSNQAVNTYKAINDIVWFGNLYRLISPYEENRSVLMYVNDTKSRAILYNYMLNARYKEMFSRVKLQGLDPQKKYRLKEINLFPDTKSLNPDNDKVLSGDYLMNTGLNLAPGKLVPVSSNIFEITEEK